MTESERTMAHVNCNARVFKYEPIAQAVYDELLAWGPATLDLVDVFIKDAAESLGFSTTDRRSVLPVMEALGMIDVLRSESDSHRVGLYIAGDLIQARVPETETSVNPYDFGKDENAFAEEFMYSDDDPDPFDESGFQDFIGSLLADLEGKLAEREVAAQRVHGVIVLDAGHVDEIMALRDLAIGSSRHFAVMDKDVGKARSVIVACEPNGEIVIDFEGDV